MNSLATIPGEVCCTTPQGEAGVRAQNSNPNSSTEHLSSNFNNSAVNHGFTLGVVLTPPSRPKAGVGPARPRASLPWLFEEDLLLYNENYENLLIAKIAKKHGRTVNAIKVRLRKLGLTNSLGQRIKPIPYFSPL